MSATGEPPSPEPRDPSEAGFTLLEMLVVVTITALVGEMMFPSMQRALAGLAVAQAEGALKADLRLARARAMETGAPVAFALGADGRGYGWTGAAPRALPPGLRFIPTARPAPAFFPDGSATAGEVAVAAASGRRMALAVDPATGVVAVETP